MKSKVSQGDHVTDDGASERKAKGRMLLTERSVPSIEGEELAYIDDENYQEAFERAVNEWNSITAIPILDVSWKDEAPCRPPPEPPVDKDSGLTEQATSSATDDANLRRHSLSYMTFDPTDQTKCSQLLDHLITHIKSLDLTEQLNKIERHTPRYNSITSRLARLFSFKCKSLKQSLRNERDQILALALRPFDNNDSVQVTLLTVLYQKLTRKSASLCPRIGNHWDLIGFQGTDPISDLRGVGLLGLFQLVHFVLSPVTSELAQRVYKLSLISNHTFPFSALGMSITQITLSNLRSGRLNCEINRRGSPVMQTINLFYASVFYSYFREWRDNNRTIADAGYVLEKIRKQSSTNIHQSILLILNYDQRDSLVNGRVSETGEIADAPEESLVVFTDIWSKKNQSIQ